MYKLSRIVLVTLLCIMLSVSVMPASTPVTAAPKSADIDWTVRHDLEFYKTTMDQLAKDYPNVAKVYSIGHSWRERDLWTIEITSQSNTAKKTGIYVVGNIHGNEHESAESAMYTAWWLVTNSKEKEVQDLLGKYIIYVTPVMNPDGYVASFQYPVRQNMRPTDANGDGKVFSDPYFDVNGDGFISDIYTGAKDSKVEDRKKVGVESKDFDENGIPGDDPKRSKIDMNRTFDYMWNYMDADSDPVRGGDAFGRTYMAGPATEPEVRAVQMFMLSHPVYALATLHTGEQSVLYPWCYTDEHVKDYDFMKSTAIKMVEAAEKTTGRPFYEKQSFADYPTAAEMIDWAYGRLGIHAYTIEVYAGGVSAASGDDSETHLWGNAYPEDKWEYVGDWQGLKDVWFFTSGYVQMSGKVPPDQDKIVAGTKDAILEMIKSEPHGDGPVVPEYFKWGNW